ncbi:hypothetical protein B0H14DRAFT_3507257 [Mycena olivaceomarginata]|nr:hypothetical protein B0H14DRAFT_3507257 [Mycena olivaceomarginata]
MPPMPHTKIYFSSRAQAIVKGTQCEHHSLRSRDPHAQGLSQVPGRTTGTNWTSVSQKSEGGRHEEDHRWCLFQQGVDDLIDIAVVNTATLVQGGSV